jgi:hypothetical protein
MDRERFDALARSVWDSSSRRSALGALLGAALLGPLAPLASAKRKPKEKHQRRRKRKKGNKGHGGTPHRCYTGTACQPGPGQDNAECDFSQSTLFHKLDVQGSDLSGANFIGAQLSEANLQDVDLSGACLVGANLHGAIIDDSTNLEGAIFCRTLMPDGSINDQDCGKATACCLTLPPTCPEGEDCGSDDCTTKFGEVCSVFGIGYANCCYPLVCTPDLASPFLTFCQFPCSKDDTCERLVGPNSRCHVDLGNCPYLNGGRCCSQP